MYSAPAYRATLRHFGARRVGPARRYRQAATAAQRAAHLASARQLLLTTLDSTVFPAWEGTPGALNGTTWEPRRGSIACGYFATMSLHDAGLHLRRTRLAKPASEVIIKNLTFEAHISRYSRRPNSCGGCRRWGRASACWGSIFTWRFCGCGWGCAAGTFVLRGYGCGRARSRRPAQRWCRTTGWRAKPWP